MKVVVTGARGQLGRELCASRPDGVELFAWDRAECDITDRDLVSKRVGEVRPSLIIHTAADTQVDASESRPDAAFAVNAEGSENVARAAAEVGARLVAISTDFVFDGQTSKPYRTSDATNPLSVYGKSKLAGEERTLGVFSEASIVRTSWLYSTYGHNFPRTMLRLFEERDELGVVSDQVGSPTNARGVAKMIWHAREEMPAGVLHWSDAGVASWYDFAVAVFEEAQALETIRRPVSIRPIGTEDYPTPAARPAYSVLDCRSTVEVLGVTPQHWRSSLREMLRSLKEIEDE